MISFKTFFSVSEGFGPSHHSEFAKQLHALKPHIAAAAQKEYDEWQQDEHGHDEEVGCGGICDRISGHIHDIVNQHVPSAHTREGGQDGDDHSWVIAHNGHEAHSIDIPPHVYETGSGYKWKKKPNVKIRPEHVQMDKLDIHPREFEDEY